MDSIKWMWYCDMIMRKDKKRCIFFCLNTNWSHHCIANVWSCFSPTKKRSLCIKFKKLCGPEKCAEMPGLLLSRSGCHLTSPHLSRAQGVVSGHCTGPVITHQSPGYRAQIAIFLLGRVTGETFSAMRRAPKYKMQILYWKYGVRTIAVRSKVRLLEENEGMGEYNGMW